MLAAGACCELVRARAAPSEQVLLLLSELEKAHLVVACMQHSWQQAHIDC
jgi:hypothetical protein